jgi:hypothetical protein
MVMAAAMGGATTAVVATIMDGPEVAATTMAGVTIAIGDLTQWGEAPQLAAFFIWAKRACRLLARLSHTNPLGNCPLLGVDRKRRVGGQNDAIDPIATSTSISC